MKEGLRYSLPIIINFVRRVGSLTVIGAESRIDVQKLNSGLASSIQNCPNIVRKRLTLSNRQRSTG